MENAQNPPVMSSRQPPRRRWRRVLAALLVIAMALLAWFWGPLKGKATAAAAFGAHVGCSCRYIEGRPLADCRKDFEQGMSVVTLAEDEEQKSVTARFPLLAADTARYRPGEGCVLEPWQD